MYNLDQFKVAFFDLDGTLLNSKGEVLESSISAIKKLKEKHGVSISIATGRAFFGTTKAINALSINSPSMFFSGSLVINPATREKVLELTLDTKRLLELISYCRENKIYAELYTENAYFIEYKNEFTDVHTSLLNVAPKIESFSNFHSISKILKVVLIERLPEGKEKLDNVIKNFPDLNFGLARGATHEDIMYANVTSSEASRERAFHAVMDALGAKGFETIAFGDAVSDIPLLGLATIGIAMGNSTLEVKARAKFVTKDADSDGIAFALQTLFPGFE